MRAACAPHGRPRPGSAARRRRPLPGCPGGAPARRPLHDPCQDPPQASPSPPPARRRPPRRPQPPPAAAPPLHSTRPHGRALMPDPCTAATATAHLAHHRRRTQQACGRPAPGQLGMMSHNSTPFELSRGRTCSRTMPPRHPRIGHGAVPVTATATLHVRARLVTACRSQERAAARCIRQRPHLRTRAQRRRAAALRPRPRPAAPRGRARPRG